VRQHQHEPDVRKIVAAVVAEMERNRKPALPRWIAAYGGIALAALGSIWGAAAYAANLRNEIAKIPQIQDQLSQAQSEARAAHDSANRAETTSTANADKLDQIAQQVNWLTWTMGGPGVRPESVHKG